MDVLVSLGTNASYIFSVITLLFERAHQVCRLNANCLLHHQSRWATTSVGVFATKKLPQYHYACCCCASVLSIVAAIAAIFPEMSIDTGADGCSWVRLQASFEGKHPAEFFETCAMLITFICLGKYLECAAKGKTSAAIAALVELAPPTAVLLEVDSNGKISSEQEISTALVQCGDALKVLSPSLPPFFCTPLSSHGCLRLSNGIYIAFVMSIQADVRISVTRSSLSSQI